MCEKYLLFITNQEENSSKLVFSEFADQTLTWVSTNVKIFMDFVLSYKSKII